MLAMLVAAAMLALWFDVRLGESRPDDLSRRVVHVAVSMGALFAAVAVIGLAHGIPHVLFMLVVLTMFLPTLVYSLLCALWMLRSLAELAPR